MITILLIASWIGSTWYISKQTKNALHNPQGTITNIEILSYQQGFTTSKLHFKPALKTGNEVPDPLLQNTLFNADIHHSPIALRKSKLQIGSSYWEVRLDQDSLPNHIQKKSLSKKHSSTLLTLLQPRLILTSIITLTMNSTYRKL